MNFSLDKQKREITQQIEKTMRGAALELFGAIVQDTPVRTGRLRGNWQSSLNTPSDEILESYTPQDLKKPLAGYKLNDILLLCNNLAYAERIENGYSQQRPNGMVKVNVQRFQSILDAQARANKG